VRAATGLWRTSGDRRELDDVTLSRARSGDPMAFQRLVETHQDAVFGLLGRFFGARNAALVEDVAQTAFLGVYRALPRFDPAGPARLSTWILAIATRTALKELRGARPTVPVDSIAEALAAPQRTDADVERRGFVAALVRALAELAPNYRAVFLLREYHGLEYKEIADGLELDLGTVKSRLARARSQLREQLREYAP
jgi:RNA polymerase sigma-70 factor, ECF subfamily